MKRAQQVLPQSVAPDVRRGTHADQYHLLTSMATGLVAFSLFAVAEDAPAPNVPLPSITLTNAPVVGSTNAAPTTAAGKSNRIDITSKQLRMDTEKKIAHFDGDVLVNDPQFQLRSNRMIVYLNPNGSGMDRAEAYEDVVIVQESQKRKAYCQKAVYTAADGKMVLTGEPQIESDKGVTRGDVITIYRNNNLISIEGNTSTTIELGEPVSTNAPPADGTPAGAPAAESTETNSPPPRTTN